MFRENISFHINISNKSADEETVTDTMKLSKHYFPNWAILADEGCTSLENDFRVTILSRKLRHG